MFNNNNNNNNNNMVAILTIEQKDQLVGQTYDGVCYYNPIQDINDNWIISQEEVIQSNIDWVKQLPLSEYRPKPVEDVLNQ